MRPKKKFLLAFSDWIGKIPELAFEYRWRFVLFFIGFTAFLLAGLPRIQMDESIESWFREDNTELQEYNFFRYIFGSDESILVLYRPKDGDIFSKESLREVSEVEEKLNRLRVQDSHPLNRIRRIRTIVSADYLESTRDSLINRPFVGEQFPESKLQSESLRRVAFQHKTFPKTFFSEDSQYGIMVIQTDFGSRLKEAPPIEGTSESEEFDFSPSQSSRTITTSNLPDLEKVQMDGYAPFVQELTQVFSEKGWLKQVDLSQFDSKAPHYFIVGTPYVMDFFFRVILQEFGMVIILCLGVVVFSLLLTIRSLPGVIWPTLIVFCAIFWTMGLIGWTGTVMTSMINIVAFLVLASGMAACIHILSGFRLHFSLLEDSKKALVQTYKSSGPPVILAGITTIGGMLSLAVVPIVPIRHFAFFSSLGVFMAIFGVLFLLPALLAFWSPRPQKTHSEVLNSRLQRLIRSLGEFGIRKPWKSIFLFSLFMLVIAAGIFKIRIDSNMKEQIKAGYGLREAYQTMDDFFGGTTNVEIVIDTGKSNGVKNPELLKAIEKFEEFVLQKQSQFISRIDSIVHVAKDSYQNMTNGSEENYKLPSDSQALSNVLITFDSADPETRKLFVDDDWRSTRMTLLSYTKGSYEYAEFMGNLRKWKETFFSPFRKEYPDLKVTLTGGMPLMIELNDFIARSQLMSFGLALAVICMVLFILYQSIKFGLIALVPNLFPIVVTAGVIGWSGIPLDSDTLLVIPIAIGIAVDDTIHFLTHYRAALLRGKDSITAIFDTLKEVGQAIFFTSFVLCLGFLTFVYSAYQPMTNFGVFSALAILTALVADLVLLPALIVLAKPFQVKEV